MTTCTLHPAPYTFVMVTGSGILTYGHVALLAQFAKSHGHLTKIGEVYTNDMDRQLDLKTKRNAVCLAKLIIHEAITCIFAGPCTWGASD